MKTTIKIFSLLLLLFMITSCEKEIIETTVTEETITFNATMVDDADFFTRADGITTNTLASMTVFCYNTKDKYLAEVYKVFTPNWMYNSEVKRTIDPNIGVWTVTPNDASNDLWDAESKHTFFAFAPREIIGGTFSPQTQKGTPTLSYTVPLLASQQSDILTAYVKDRTYTWQDIPAHTVKFKLVHVLAHVQFTAVMIGDSRPNETVTITGFTFSNLRTSGVLTVPVEDNVPDWVIDPAFSSRSSTIEDGLIDHELTTTQTNITAPGGAMMMLPQNFEHTNGILTVAMDVEYHGTTTPITQEFELKHLNNPSLEQAHSYTYQFTYRKRDVPLTLTVAMEEWTSENVDTEIPNTENTVLKLSTSKLRMDYIRLGKTFTTNDFTYTSTNKVTLDVEGVKQTTNTIQTGNDWLTATLTPAADQKSGAIEFTYNLDNTPDKTPFVLTFTSGKVVNKLEVIYDNGYLTPEVLNTIPREERRNWAPFGIHLAKKGSTQGGSNNPNALPIAPDGELNKIIRDLAFAFKNENTDTRSIVSSPNLAALVYKMGLKNTNAMFEANTFIAHTSDAGFHPAAAYCRRLGTEWYLPNGKEMAFILNNKDYFGDSYLLTFTSYKTSSAHTDTHGWYVMAYSSGFVQLQTGEKTGASNVRCVMDLHPPQ